jgi:integrase
MLSHAVDWGYLRANPAAKIRYPKVPRREMDALTPAEVRKFLEHVPVRWYAFFAVAITTGLRIGELLAMRWRNLDCTRGQYFVRETWQRPRGGRSASFSFPKTESSIAPVDLPPEVLEALRTHRAAQSEEMLKAEGPYQEQDLIFATADGGPLDDAHIVQRVFRPALTAAALRRIRFHDLRHTTASLLIAQGENPKYVQKQMRHASSDITFDRYGHLYPDSNREAVERMSRLLFGPASSTLERVG